MPSHRRSLRSQPSPVPPIASSTRKKKHRLRTQGTDCLNGTTPHGRARSPTGLVDELGPCDYNTPSSTTTSSSSSSSSSSSLSCPPPSPSTKWRRQVLSNLDEDRLNAVAGGLICMCPFPSLTIVKKDNGGTQPELEVARLGLADTLVRELDAVLKYTSTPVNHPSAVAARNQIRMVEAALSTVVINLHSRLLGECVLRCALQVHTLDGSPFTSALPLDKWTDVDLVRKMNEARENELKTLVGLNQFSSDIDVDIRIVTPLEDELKGATRLHKWASLDGLVPLSTSLASGVRIHPVTVDNKEIIDRTWTWCTPYEILRSETENAAMAQAATGATLAAAAIAKEEEAKRRSKSIAERVAEYWADCSPADRTKVAAAAAAASAVVAAAASVAL